MNSETDLFDDENPYCCAGNRSCNCLAFGRKQSCDLEIPHAGDSAPGEWFTIGENGEPVSLPADASRVKALGPMKMVALNAAGEPTGEAIEVPGAALTFEFTEDDRHSFGLDYGFPQSITFSYTVTNPENLDDLLSLIMGGLDAMLDYEAALCDWEAEGGACG